MTFYQKDFFETLHAYDPVIMKLCQIDFSGRPYQKFYLRDIRQCLSLSHVELKCRSLGHILDLTCVHAGLSQLHEALPETLR